MLFHGAGDEDEWWRAPAVAQRSTWLDLTKGKNVAHLKLAFGEREWSSHSPR